MRLWVPQGGTREVVILDVGPGPILDEHTWRNPETGRWDMHQRCCAERDTCPLCNQEETFGPFRRDMYLMAADLGWRARDNRKLLVLRDQRIHDMLAAAGGEDGWRGLTLRLERGEKQRAPLGTGTLLGRSGTRDLPGAFDCETLMPLLDGAALRKLYGGSSPPGSREESEAAFAAAEMEAA